MLNYFVIANCCLAGFAFADVKLPRVFSDGAVLQRDQALPIWGWADPMEQVTVTLGGQSEDTVTSNLGRWEVILEAQPMTTESLTLRVEGKNRLEVRDILLGDVWLCSGQSNMEFPLGACDASEDIQNAKFPLIRQFGVEMNFAQAPATDVRGQWTACSPQSAPAFSAVAYYFASRIHRQTGVPIGILRSSVGGTNIECWMSQETLLTTPELEPFAKLMRESLAIYQQELTESLPSIASWVEGSQLALQVGEAIPLPPVWPEFPFGEKRFRPRCVTLHNGMIAPLIPMALKGVLWYQGENNAGGPSDCEQYIEKKRALINNWRDWFGNPQLPFYFVQLAAWQQPSNDPGIADGWALFRDAQRRCLDIPYTGMASAIDIGDAEDIHPKNKFDVGERLALWALANDYGQVVEASGPLFRELTIQGRSAIVHFDHASNGLMVGRKSDRMPAVEDLNGQLNRFAIAGGDRKWHWATASIDGNTVICSHPEVQNPVAVRYACSMNPKGANLYNRSGLPASPFRTDEW